MMLQILFLLKTCVIFCVPMVAKRSVIGINSAEERTMASISILIGVCATRSRFPIGTGIDMAYHATDQPEKATLGADD